LTPSSWPPARAAAVCAVMFNALAWGVSWWPFRALQERGLHALWATGLVYCLALVGLLCWRRRAWQGLRQTSGLWLLFAASGVTNVAFNWGVTIGDVVRVVLLFYLMPAWSMLLAWWRLGERPRGMGLAQLALSWLGVGLVLLAPHSTGGGPSVGLPEALGLLGGLSFALTNVMLRQLAQTPSEHRAFAMFAGGAALSLVVAAFGSGMGFVPMPGPAAAWIAPAVALALWFIASNLSLQYGAARLSARTTALVLTAEVWFASISAVALGAAVLTSAVVAGGVLIVAAALWAALTPDQTP
jgi:drug/metabolite transporter (DMT)-like permease